MAPAPDDRAEQEAAAAAARSAARSEILAAIQERSDAGERLVLALAPELARFLYGYDPEPGARFVGIPMVIEPFLAPLGWQLRRL